MGVDGQLFAAGQEVETKSFLKGFRGAWFRCKIEEIAWRLGQQSANVNYLDFPGEKITWIKMYQKQSKELHSMVRPPYPPIYHESTLPDVDTIAEVVVIINDEWKVGALVDWFKDGCYWCARVTEVLKNDKVKIELPPPPVGEGYTYEVSCKELRPSLDWSPKDGWTIPKAMESKNSHLCARLIKLGNQGNNGLDEMAKKPSRTVTAKETPMPKTNVESDLADSGIRKPSCSDSVSSSHIKNASPGMGRNATGKDKVDNSGPLKKMKTDGRVVLNSMKSDTLEAAILDFEELVNRVNWMKGVLEIGMPLKSVVRPNWKFLSPK